ncbi:MAG: hypothetical protein KDN19_16695 [Verrucomicrobiae bacterium]|nr:hypothetical protein [Verrucomicrobiae bacterium]
METTVAAPEIRLRFGQSVSSCVRNDQELVLDLAVPLLAGAGEERVIGGDEATFLEEAGDFQVLRRADGEVVAGAAILPCPDLAEGVAYRLYHQLLDLTRDQSLYRVWHFVPGINAVTEGLEHYQSFNIGRCRAFRETFGDDSMEAHLPAASAVGVSDPQLAIVFLSGREPVSYFENPHQVPAYQYPEQYGPCSPSFARGALVTQSEGRRAGYLSGTAAIRGHESVAIDDVASQLDITMENVEAVLEQMGLPGALKRDSGIDSQLRIYLRRREDLGVVRDRLATLVGPEIAASTMFLNADICRSTLRLEIEGIFSDSTGLGR